MTLKQDIRRVLFGTCTVTPSRDFVVTPYEVTVTVQRRLGCWPWLVTSSRRVGTFTFQELLPWQRISSHGVLDLEYLFKCIHKSDSESTQVKICVKDFYEERRVFRLCLEEFLGQLLHGGRQEWFFLDICEGKVSLWLANQTAERRWHSDGSVEDKCLLDSDSDDNQGKEGETEEKDSLEEDDETQIEEEDGTETEREDSLVENTTTQTERRRRFVRLSWRYSLLVIVAVVVIHTLLGTLLSVDGAKY